MPPNPEPLENGRLIAYRLGQVEQAVNVARECLSRLERCAERDEAHWTSVVEDVMALEKRVERVEGKVTDLRIEMAKWAAGGALGGGALSALIVKVLEQLLG